ncbi:hypothetical protein [Pseudomonas aeruginosa]|uniref:hypothetical protein n=1 Tax=Pseudomonas aeruginosa TaxID=287 RepID=UPI000F7DE9BC|nr:hypothetical protein [Pseudomonas aeruginosa]RTB44100.1 hypothetical protein EJ655_08150 [Pseudomonas aeruginosa]
MSTTPSQPTGNTSTFDDVAWRAVCKKAAQHASNGCGLAHDHYVELLSSDIDDEIAQLPEHQRAQALQVAQEWEYATPAEREQTRDWNAANGYCRHGLDPDCCPAGCGDL